MGFTSLIQDQVSSVFNIIGDLAKTIYYSSVSGAEYDVTTGQMVDTIVYLTPRAVLARFTEKELDNSISVVTDRKCLIPALDMKAPTGGAIVPKTDDYFVDSIGRKWSVRKMISDPADSLFILQIRLT